MPSNGSGPLAQDGTEVIIERNENSQGLVEAEGNTGSRGNQRQLSQLAANRGVQRCQVEEETRGLRTEEIMLHERLAVGRESARPIDVRNSASHFATIRARGTQVLGTAGWRKKSAQKESGQDGQRRRASANPA